MDIDLTTPALLFPAISLLLLAYTNRFLALSALIRTLDERYRREQDERALRQIGKLRSRVLLIRLMQHLGVGGLLLCVVCMLLLFLGWAVPARAIFVLSLGLMATSLGVSLWEIQVSMNALDIQLDYLERERERSGD